MESPLRLPVGTNMCDNCHSPHDTSSRNSCASAQRGMLPACVSTHSNLFFPLNTLFYPALHITSLSLLLFITLFFTRMKSPSLCLSYCSFYLLLLLNFQTHYVRFFSLHACILFLVVFSMLARSATCSVMLYVISTSESVLQLAVYGFSSTNLTL